MTTATTRRPAARRRLSVPTALAALLACGPALAQVYACGTGAARVFQDTPCPAAQKPPPQRQADHVPGVTKMMPQAQDHIGDATQKATARPPIGDPAYEAARDAERLRAIQAYGQQAGRELGEAMARDATECGPRGRAAPFVGATADWVRRCSTWGAPTSTLNTTTATGTTSMWTYRLQGFLFFDAAGRVRTVQQK